MAKAQVSGTSCPRPLVRAEASWVTKGPGLPGDHDGSHWEQCPERAPGQREPAPALDPPRCPHPVNTDVSYGQPSRSHCHWLPWSMLLLLSSGWPWASGQPSAVGVSSSHAGLGGCGWPSAAEGALGDVPSCCPARRLQGSAEGGWWPSWASPSQCPALTASGATHGTARGQLWSVAKRSARG